MTRAEAAKLISIVVAAYPQSDKYNSEKQVEETVNLWAMMFEDDNSKLVALAVKKHIATNKWPPSIAEIRKIMAEIEHPELLPPDQAWAYVADVLKILRDEHTTGIYYDERNTPPLIAETVTALGGWSRLLDLQRGIYNGNKSEQDKDTFIFQYRPAYERELERAMLPWKTREILSQATNQFGKKTIAAIQAVRETREKSEMWFKQFSFAGARALKSCGDETEDGE